MKRDPRLHGLSSEHHHGLVLARRVLQGRLDAAAVRQRFDADLAPHFQTEEELLLPALDEAGAAALSARTRAEHTELRGLLGAAERGDPGRLAEFATLLEQHIRFEERELFPAAQALLSPEQLGRVFEHRRKPVQGSEETVMCSHLRKFAGPDREPVTPSSHGCKECLAAGDSWVHLRLCLTCGHVGCCDDSPHRHATRHFHGSKHPVIKSFEPGEDWAWCFADEELLESIPSYGSESPPRHYDPPGAVSD